MATTMEILKIKRLGALKTITAECRKNLDRFTKIRISPDQYRVRIYAHKAGTSYDITITEKGELFLNGVDMDDEVDYRFGVDGYNDEREEIKQLFDEVVEAELASSKAQEINWLDSLVREF